MDDANALIQRTRDVNTCVSAAFPSSEILKRISELKYFPLVLAFPDEFVVRVHLWL